MQDEDTLQIIRKITWTYIKKNPGLEFDDLFSEACIAYLTVMDKYDPKRAKQSTFIWKVVSNHLHSFIKNVNTKKYKEILNNEQSLLKHNAPNPEQVYLAKKQWEELIAQLSPEAQTIYFIINNTDVPINPEKPRKTRGMIAKTLQEQKGWKPTQIWAVFREIKEKLQIS